MKLKLAAVLIALPLGMSMLAKSASAAEVNGNFSDGYRSQPSSIVADRTTPDQYQRQEAQRTAAPTTPTQHKHHQNFLNLTADQQAKMKQIHQTERTAIDNILTADQKAQLKAERQNHERAEANRGTAPTGKKKGVRHAPFASLNLTADQRSQIESVRRNARAQMDAILTPEQRQQEQQHMKQRQQANPQATQSR